MPAISNSCLGFVALLTSLVCLGTWPALLRLCSVSLPASSRLGCWPFSIAQHFPRNICHVYMDYATAYFIISMIPFMMSRREEVSLGLFRSVTAGIGGGLLSAGNLSMQWAVTVFQAPLTTVLAIQSSLTVVLGTSLNYWIEPSKTPHPHLLLFGVFVFLAAIGFASVAQFVYTQSHCNKSSIRRHDSDGIELELPYGTHAPEEHQESLEGPSNPTTTIPMIDDGMAPPLFHSSVASQPWHGILVAIAGGLCFGFFSPAVNIAVNDPFGWTNNVTATAGTVAKANLWFSACFWMASVVGNIALLGRNQDLSVLEVVGRYGREESSRGLALAAGVVCAAGNLLQFQGGQLVGYATADLVQAYPLVSTVWDVIWFGEFRHVPLVSLVLGLLVAMYSAYLSGIILLAGSSVG